MVKYDWLKNLRKSKNITLCKISQLTGLSDCYLSQIETGKRKPSVETAKKIAECLDIDWTKFYE